jgi:hypothetical protein
MSIANGQTVLKFGETVLTSLPLHHQSTSINIVEFIITSIAFCQTCNIFHLKRVNYRVGIWKRTHIARPVYPEPTHENGWQCVDGMIEPKWVSGDFLPKQLADVLVGTALSSDLIIAQIIHTGDLFTAIQQAGKSLHVQKQIF